MRKQLIIYGLLVALSLVIFTPVAHAQHCTVKRGDSMWRIADRYNVLFKDILELNKHYKNPHMIHPKDKIELPDGSEGHSTSNGSEGDNIQDGNDTPIDTGESTEAQQVLNLVNQERAKQGLNALTLNSNLSNVATMKAKDMADNNYFNHNSPTYGSPFEMMQRFNVDYSSAGENIAAGQKSAEQVMQDWMNSSGHRANILNKNYTELGVGFYKGGSYGTYWVQMFRKP